MGDSVVGLSVVGLSAAVVGVAVVGVGVLGAVVLNTPIVHGDHGYTHNERVTGHAPSRKRSIASRHEAPHCARCG